MIFQPGKLLYSLAAKFAEQVYEDYHSIGLTQFNIWSIPYLGHMVQILAIAGSNEVGDWFLNGNFDLRSIKGLKRGGYKEAEKIFDSTYFKDMRDTNLPLLIVGHSRGGPGAIGLKRHFCTDAYCIPFAPARSLRYTADRYMDNTTIFIDKDDPVPMVGFFSFGHPRCNRVYVPDNHIGYSIWDHPMAQYRAFIETMTD